MQSVPLTPSQNGIHEQPLLLVGSKHLDKHEIETNPLAHHPAEGSQEEVVKKRSNKATSNLEQRDNQVQPMRMLLTIVKYRTYRYIR